MPTRRRSAQGHGSGRGAGREPAQHEQDASHPQAAGPAASSPPTRSRAARSSSASGRHLWAGVVTMGVRRLPGAARPRRGQVAGRQQPRHWPASRRVRPGTGAAATARRAEPANGRRRAAHVNRAVGTGASGDYRGADGRRGRRAPEPFVLLRSLVSYPPAARQPAQQALEQSCAPDPFQCISAPLLNYRSCPYNQLGLRHSCCRSYPTLSRSWIEPSYVMFKDCTKLTSHSTHPYTLKQVQPCPTSHFFPALSKLSIAHN